MESRNNTLLTATASIAGLAVGAALGILFAPKNHSNTEPDEDALFTDHSVEGVWKTTNNNAGQFQGPENIHKNPSAINEPSA